MTIRRIAAIVLAVGTLTAGASFAQSADTSSFQAQLNEAKSSTTASREMQSTVATHLSAAEALHARGNAAEAEQYLNFARGMLGLDTVTSTTQVGERTGARNAVN